MVRSGRVGRGNTNNCRLNLIRDAELTTGGWMRSKPYANNNISKLFSLMVIIMLQHCHTS